jgi:LysR family transcriptional repressor of citA
MDTASLQTFVVAARTENFRRTAQLRFLSQATVTQQIRKLEVELGTPLFERKGRRVQLNRAGSAFLPHAERLLAQARQAAEACRTAGAGRAAPLRIAASPHVAGTLLPNLLRQFPEPWSLVVVPSPEVPRLIEEGVADVGLTRARPRASGLLASRILEDPLVLVSAEGDMAGEPALPVFARLLEQETVFTYMPEATWVAIDLALGQLGIRLCKPMPVAQVGIAKAFVLRGLGISILPRLAVTAEMRMGRLVEVPTPGVRFPHDETYLVGRADLPEVAVPFWNFTERFARREPRGLVAASLREEE